MDEPQRTKRDWETPITDEESATTTKRLLDEARAEGLCHDILLDAPFNLDCMPTPPAPAAGDLEDWTELDVALKAAVFDLQKHGERWAVDKESAGFLASVLALGKPDGQSSSFDPTRLAPAAITVEEPILQCDPQLEIQRLRSRNTITLSTHGLLPFALDLERGESIEWPNRELLLHKQKDEEAANEKLEIGMDAAKFIRVVAQPPLMSDAEMARCFIEANKPTILRPLTPPLLTLSPPFSPQAPPATLMEVDFTSTPEDLLALEAAQTERRIMQADELAIDEPDRLAGLGQDAALDAVNAFSLRETPSNSSSSPTKRKQHGELHVDIPLLPDSGVRSSSPMASKGVRFPEEVHSLIPLPESDLSIIDPKIAEKDINDFVIDVIQPIAESANAQAENEELIDTTMRVPVPPIVKASPPPPWTQHSGIDHLESQVPSQRALLGYIRRELLKGETSWSGVSKLERTLAWSPFPARLAKVKIDDDFFDDGSAGRYMASLVTREDIDLGGLVSKTQGLRVFEDHESDDDELEPLDSDDEEEGAEQAQAIDVAQQSSPARSSQTIPGGGEQAELASPIAPARPARVDMRTLLRKRKLELECANKALTVDARPQPEDITKKPRTTATMAPKELLKESGITGFMQLHGTIAEIPTWPQDAVTTHHQTAAPQARMVAPPEPVTNLSTSLTFPRPKPVNLDRAMQAVATTKVLTDRSLVRSLHALLPSLELVERAPIRPQAEHGIGSTLLSDHTEADLTLSPATGLLSATLQKLKQKSLPGQANYFGVRERMEAVSLHYERLVVLVTHSQQLGASEGRFGHALAEGDCEALSDFMAFTASLRADISVRLVPESEHARWIAASICQQAVAKDGDMQLLQDETLWERFLRAAGLNASAAQVILSQLKLPERLIDDEVSSMTLRSDGDALGLAAFARLSVEQRVERFGPLLGGDRVLRHVSEAIDSGWQPASAVRE